MEAVTLKIEKSEASSFVSAYKRGICIPGASGGWLNAGEPADPEPSGC